MALQDIVTKGSTDRSVTLRAIDNTTGLPVTSLVYNSSGIDLWYRREGAAVTSITEATLAALTTAHADGGFLHVANGEYRLDLPDAAFATGANYFDYGGTVTGATFIGGRVRLVDINLEDSVRAGLTALPNAAAAASGGLHILGTNATAVSYTGGMTISNSGGSALTLSSSGSNGSGLNTSGNGSGSGILATGGATGHGVSGVGGATSGNGIRGAGTAGNSAGINAVGQGSAAGLLATGGATGAGISAVGGATSGAGISAAGAAGNSNGVTFAGFGTGHGLAATSGAGATGNGATFTAGSTNGNGLALVKTGSGVALASPTTDIVLAKTTNITGLNDIAATAIVSSGAITTSGGAVSTVSTLTGHTPQTGDTYARLGAPAGASVSADVAAIKTDTGNLVTRITSTLFSGITSLAEWLGLLAGKQTGNSTARTELRATGAGSGTFDETTDSMEAVRDRGDAAWTTATGFSTLDAAGVRTAVGLASANMDTQFAAMATAANLATANGVLAKLDDTLEDDGGTFRFTTNALEQAPSGTGASAASIVEAMFTTDTGETEADAVPGSVVYEIVQNAGGGSSDWTADEKTAIRAILGIPGSGTTPADPSTGILDTIRDAALAVKAKTDNLPASPASSGDITTAIGSGGASLNAIPWNAAWDAEVQSEVTDALNAYDPPTKSEMDAAIAAGDDAVLSAISGLSIPTAAAIADAVHDEALSGHTTPGSAGAALNDTDKRGSRTVIRGTVSSTSPSTTGFTPSALSPSGAAADQFKGRILIFDNDTSTPELRGQATDVTANTSASLPVFTFTALTTAPSSGDTLSIV